MTDREMFMYEIWKTAMANRNNGHGKIKDPAFTWECVKHFWYPVLTPIAERSGF